MSCTSTDHKMNINEKTATTSTTNSINVHNGESQRDCVERMDSLLLFVDIAQKPEPQFRKIEKK